MAFSNNGRIRVNVTGARGALGIDLQGTPTPGQYLVKGAGGGRSFTAVTPPGAIANAVKITDLANSTGANLVGYGGRSLNDKLKESVSVKDAPFNAVGDGVNDDTAEIQAAIDFVESNGGGTVFLPRSTYKTTGPIYLRSKVSLVGDGPASILRPNVCHGIIIEKSDEIAPRRVANLRIYGNGGENFSGIYADVSFPDRVQGMVFENLFIDFFGTVIRGKGFWHTSFKSIRANQCRRGVWIYNRAVKITIDDCSFIRGGAIVNTEDSVGLQIGDEASGLRPEDVQVTNSIIFGFDIGVRIRQALFGGIVNCDIDACASKVFEIITADGGFTIDDNWCDIIGSTGNLYGIHALPLGYDPPPINISITNNRIRVPNTSTAGAEAAGMLFEQNQSNYMVMGNSLTGDAPIAIRAEGVTSGRVERCEFIANKASGQARFFNMAGCSIDKNTFDGGIILSGNVNMNYGKNFGAHTTQIRCSISIPAGQTSATATYFSMNMPDLPLGGYEISAVATERSTEAGRAVSVNPTRSQVTVTVPTAGNASGVDVHIDIF